MRITTLILGLFAVLLYATPAIANDYLINLPPRIAKDHTPKASYDGLYFISLITRERDGKTQTSFQILDRDAALVFQAVHWYLNEENLTILWDLEGRVWVYSPEKGLSFWQAHNNLTWRKNDYQHSHVRPPPYLTQNFPDYFKVIDSQK